MRPTIAEQLGALGRLVDELAAAPELSDDSAGLALSVATQLKRVAASAAARGPFLRWDNATMSAVLGRLAPTLPDELERSAADLVDHGEAPLDDEARNEQLRRLLTDVIEALPDDEHGYDARRLIAEHLRERAAANPALHRNPRLPWAGASGDRATDEEIR